MEVSTASEIAQVRSVRPHLVFVGAGASRAALPDGDAQGRRLPVMNDLVGTVGLDVVLDRAGVDHRSRNFEELYSDVASDPARHALRAEIEEAVFAYFADLSLPPHPTIYDQLVLSLRRKDIIATFNWDPFLIQAYRRNAKAVPSLPQLLFLHGNVLAGYCAADEIRGVRGGSCSRCGEPFAPTPLLFPIANKDYSDNPAIQHAWEVLRNALKEALFVTVFGYGAPRSDKAAVAAMARAWGKAKDRQFEQVELIDIRPEGQLRRSWRRFIHTHHSDVVNSFAGSWIANHPRRSVEAFYNQYIEALFIENNPVPLPATLPTLWSWFAPLGQAEIGAKGAV